VEVLWSNSAFKHGISREDISHAIEFKSYTKKLTSEADGSEVWLYIGPQHSGTNRELEILVNILRNRDLLVFHAMKLTSKFDDLRKGERDEAKE
jgi:hypothetical protein